MNVLMALSQLEVTGAEVYATSVGGELTRRGHQVFYVSDTLTKEHQGGFFELRFNKRSIPRRFWHVGYLIYLIKKHNIQLVHAHSRASSWSCHLACKLTNTPMVTSVHGRQPMHITRRKCHAMGNKALPICEAIYHQLINDLNVSPKMLEVSRNGIDTEQYSWLEAPKNNKKVITIISRLTGPKGEICYRLLNDCLDLDKYDVKLVSGSHSDGRFDKFKSRADFIGYSDNIPEILAKTDLLIGAGRVAIESLLCGRPTFAIGEANCIGLVTENNVNQAMASNFGDVGSKGLNIDFSIIPEQIDTALLESHCDIKVTEIIKKNYKLESTVNQLENIYQSVYVRVKRKDIPVLMYHRFADSDENKSNMAPYIHIDKFEKHLKLLKFFGFETLTFSDFAKNGTISRIKAGKRFCMITVDDGFKDNYQLMLPLLKKYDFKAVIYMVSGVDYNKWDVEHPETPEKRFDLMNVQEIEAMARSGHIEFGGHTLTHPRLSKLSLKEKQKEIIENKQKLEEIIGKPLFSFAYPYGDLDEESKTLVKQAGYQFAVATNSGPLALHKDVLEIRRIGIYPGTDTFAFARKIIGGYLYRKTAPKNRIKEKLNFFLRNKTRIEKGNEIIFSKGNRIRYCNVEIKGEGNRLIFEEGANLKGVQIEINGLNCTVRIGKNCVIGEGCYLSAKEINTVLSIGNGCMFSRNVKVMTSDGHDITDVHTDMRINQAKNIYIGNKVWLADGAIILKGCNVGDNSIIGLNAIVTKDIPNGAIAAGIPARIVKDNIQWHEKLTY